MPNGQKCEDWLKSKDVSRHHVVSATTRSRPATVIEVFARLAVVVCVQVIRIAGVALELCLSFFA